PWNTAERGEASRAILDGSDEVIGGPRSTQRESGARARARDGLAPCFSLEPRARGGCDEKRCLEKRWVQSRLWSTLASSRVTCESPQPRVCAVRGGNRFHARGSRRIARVLPRDEKGCATFVETASGFRGPARRSRHALCDRTRHANAPFLAAGNMPHRAFQRNAARAHVRDGFVG